MSYAFQGTVVIPPATGSTQTNITLVITGTDVKLKTVANGGQIQNTVSRVGQTVPADLILSSDQAGLNLYNWGWDFYDAVNGIATIWVLIPSLTSGASITIYVSIGNAAISTYQGGVQGSEFDGNTKAVFHFSDNLATAVVLDSSANSLNATNSSNTSTKSTTGQIGKALTYVSASSDNTVVINPLTLGTGSQTIKGWFKPTSVAAQQGVFSFGNTATDGAASIIGQNNIGSFQVYNGTSYNGTFVVSSGTWYLLHIVRSPTTTLWYINGTLINSSGIFNNAQTNFFMGAGFPAFADVIIDDTTLANTARSANWIATEYANQNSIPSISAFSVLINQKSRLTLLGIG